MDPFIGEIIMFGGNFAPRGWALCDGQLLAISSHQALFSILGTTYGGDGRTTFGLPELRGRVAIQQGSGPGLQTVRLGEKGGANNHILTVGQMPSHNHGATSNAVDDTPNQTSPENNALASANIYSSATRDVTLAGHGTANQGGNQSFSLMQPFLGVNFIIALVGTFPS
jgi:microcystin-dependent protein